MKIVGPKPKSILENIKITSVSDDKVYIAFMPHLEIRYDDMDSINEEKETYNNNTKFLMLCNDREWIKWEWVNLKNREFAKFILADDTRNGIESLMNKVEVALDNCYIVIEFDSFVDDNDIIMGLMTKNYYWNRLLFPDLY
jgi:hypothetical protein